MLESTKKLLTEIGVSEERSNEILAQVLETIAKNLNKEEQKKLDQYTSELTDAEMSEIGGGRAFDSTREYIENKCSKLATKISRALRKLTGRMSHGINRLADDFEDLGNGNHRR